MRLKHPVMTKTIYPNHPIGDYTYGHPKILGDGKLSIGKFCSIADGVTILLGVEHRTEWATTYPFPALFTEAQHITGHPFTKGPITIGHDVWIGHNATILSNVTIGNGAVIGAGAVVSKDVASYSIVAGNPARHVRYRFGEEWIDFLNRHLKWWDWPIDVILANIDLLLKQPDDHLMHLNTDPKNPNGSKEEPKKKAKGGK